LDLSVLGLQFIECIAVLTKNEKMIDIKKIKNEIEKLPESDFAELRRWIAEKDWEKWDTEIEKDSNANKLDFLIDEASKEKNNGNLKDL